MPDVYTRLLALIPDVMQSSSQAEEDDAREQMTALWKGMVPAERGGAARLAVAIFGRHLHHYGLGWIELETRAA